MTRTPPLEITTTNIRTVRTRRVDPGVFHPSGFQGAAYAASDTTSSTLYESPSSSPKATRVYSPAPISSSPSLAPPFSRPAAPGPGHAHPHRHAASPRDFAYNSQPLSPALGALGSAPPRPARAATRPPVQPRHSTSSSDEYPATPSPPNPALVRRPGQTDLPKAAQPSSSSSWSSSPSSPSMASSGSDAHARLLPSSPGSPTSALSPQRSSSGTSSRAASYSSTAASTPAAKYTRSSPKARLSPRPGNVRSSPFWPTTSISFIQPRTGSTTMQVDQKSDGSSATPFTTAPTTPLHPVVPGQTTTDNADKPVHHEFMYDPKTSQALEESLTHIVDHSSVHPGVAEMPAHKDNKTDAVHSGGWLSRSWITSFFPSYAAVEKLFSYEDMGNYVVDRATGKTFFEEMPLYVRVGMHLLFVSGAQYLSNARVEELLRAQSVKMGQAYDAGGPSVAAHIANFVAQFKLRVEELLVQDFTAYGNFNEFFARKLKSDARVITAPLDKTVLTSPADCRLNVFQNVDDAKKFWIKGREFTVPTLLLGEDGEPEEKTHLHEFLHDTQVSLVICRLAPQDYHRFHSPADGVVMNIHDIHGQLYTVNPQAVKEDLNVFTANKRSVLLLNADIGGAKPVPIAYVAIGAMLVGSIGWSVKPGQQVKKGDELGWFQYGGSTVIVAIPSSAGVQFDDDLLANSEKSLETLVSVGMRLGVAHP